MRAEFWYICTVDPDPPEIEILQQDGFLEVRFLGPFSVERFGKQVEQAVQACKDRNLTLLLLDYTPLTGIPTTLDRYQISVHGADAARNLHKLAGYATPEQMGEKFGALVARNRGLNVDVFTDRDEAIRWLLEPR